MSEQVGVGERERGTEGEKKTIVEGSQKEETCILNGGIQSLFIIVL